MPPKKSYESCDSDSDDCQSSRKGGSKRQKLDKNSDEYRQRRERNNLAVRKSREASRQKAKETLDRVTKLRDENKALEQKVSILNKELLVLRDLFLSHASATATAQAAAKSSSEVKPGVTLSENISINAVLKNDVVDNKDHLYFLQGDS